MLVAGLAGHWRRIARTEGFLALALVVLVLLVHAGTDLVAGLDRRFYDLLTPLAARAPSDRIALVAIDDASLARLGRWPWRREVHAALLERLASAKAQTVVEAVPFFDGEDERGLAAIRELQRDLASGPAPSPEWSRRLAQAEQALDVDGRMANRMGASGNVLLLTQLEPGEHASGSATLPAWAARSAIPTGAGAGEPVAHGHWPIAALGESSAGVGHLLPVPDADGRARELALLLDWKGQAIPSLALLAAARSLNIPTAEIRVRHGQSVQLGKLSLRIDDAGRAMPVFQPAHAGRPAFPTYGFADVLEGKVPAARFEGKLVLVGPSSPAVARPVPVPGHAALAPVELLAQATSAMLAGQLVVQPAWGTALLVALVLAAAGYLAFGVPRLGSRAAMVATVATAATLVLVSAALLWAAGLWLQLALPATLLLVGHAGLATRRFVLSVSAKVRSSEDSAETHRLMALALQGQGQLDKAFEHLQRVPLGELAMDNLYNLGLDFERRRQFDKALAVYEHMATFNAAWRDLAERMPRTRALVEVVTIGAGSGHPGGNLLLAARAGVEMPMLGRYQVEKELGKGAMGIVYQGRDPKLGRVVAIKTMSVSQDFGDASQAEARERFFAEAEIAGRLQHPSIVTVFDAGEEYDLAYIAMEFLKGQDLAAHCRPGQLLPVPRVLSIVARVADALAHAHANGVVHRDVKPANIMYEPESDTVKVTDFGIARVTDSNKTKTGVVMGTPSFMSPEQVAGVKVDSKSDIYSLGVMLFQMLAGSLPFRGETLAELLYKIGNAEPPSIYGLRPDLPPGLEPILSRAMAKKPDQRHPTADALAAELRALLATLEPGDSRPATLAVQAVVVPEPAGEFERTDPNMPGRG